MHIFSRRRSTAVGAIILTAVLLAGCGRASDSASTDVTIDDSPATGTLEVWIGGAEGETFASFVDAFEAENPDVTVNVTQIAEEDFDSKLTTAIASGTVPDVVRLYSQTESTMLATGAFAAVPDGLVDESDFFSSMWDTGVVDGTVYSLPWDIYTQVLYYRADLAEAAGVTAPTTWDEAKTFYAALQSAGATWGAGVSVGYDQYSAQDLYAYVLQNGGDFISDDKSEWTINSDANVEALEYWGSLITDGYASADGPGFLDTTSWFSQGTTGSTIIGPWFQGWLTTANSEDWTADNVATATLPAGSAGSVATLGGGKVAVLKDAANTDAAWKLVKWIEQEDTQLDWYSAASDLPSLTSAWDDPLIADNDLLNAVREELPTAVPVPQVSTWSQVGAIIGEQMERVARGQATAQEALDAAQSQAEAIGVGSE